VANEARAEQPIAPLRLFADRRRNGAYLVRMLYLGAMIGFFFFVTQLLQGVWGFTPFQAGLAFLPMSAVNFVIAVLVTRLVTRFGSTSVLAAGVALTLAGMAWLSRVGADGSYLTAVALPMVLIGIGQGLAFAPMTTAGLAGDDAHDAGAASGVVNTAHQARQRPGARHPDRRRRGRRARGWLGHRCAGGARLHRAHRLQRDARGRVAPGRRPHRPTGSSAADRPSRRRPA
jgi:predicted MFS family arabinose efflux permease